MTFFFVIVIGIGWAISWVFNDPSILLIAAVFAIVMNVASYWFSDKIVVSMAGAKPAPEKEFPDLHNMVENLAITAGLPKPKIYIINDPAPNAFATGRNEKHAVVAVTSGLLNMMDRTELEGVLAHELSHIGNKDMLVSTVAVVLVGFVTIVSDFALRGMLFGGGDRDNKNHPLIAIIAFAFIILAPIVASLLQLAVSRKREFLADASGALLTRYPEGLANALRKIGSYSAPMKRANNATAHLYISNPFGSRAFTSGLAKLFMTHPPVEERITALLGRR
ncbi:M48 family metalloprotease [Candidatus Nomurabacteria bacterium]|nr:M48 family metalloprotease [Candidatus Nomurabacteria bacterium]